MVETVNRLVQLGFSENEARAYIALLSNHPLTAYETAKMSGIPSSKIYEVLRKLENRGTIQSIQGQRSKLFIPLSPDEFINDFRARIETNLNAIKDDMAHMKGGIDAQYTWHIQDHNSLIVRARRMIDTARETVLLSLWPVEMEMLADNIEKAIDRDIKIAAIHYGPTKNKFNQLYIHPVINTIYAEREVRGFSIVSDSREALSSSISSYKTEAIWSMNSAFVIMAEGYIKHDIYQMKITKRLGPLLKNLFGDEFEKMRDVFADDS